MVSAPSRRRFQQHRPAAARCYFKSPSLCAPARPRLLQTAAAPEPPRTRPAASSARWFRCASSPPHASAGSLPPRHEPPMLWPTSSRHTAEPPWPCLAFLSRRIQSPWFYSPASAVASAASPELLHCQELTSSTCHCVAAFVPFCRDGPLRRAKLIQSNRSAVRLHCTAVASRNRSSYLCAWLLAS